MGVAYGVPSFFFGSGPLLSRYTGVRLFIEGTKSPFFFHPSSSYRPSLIPLVLREGFPQVLFFFERDN